MSAMPVIHVVDDDQNVRHSIHMLLESAGYDVREYALARTFLEGTVEQQGCVLVDMRMPEMNGLELQKEIVRRGLPLPVIIVTGHGDVPLAVRAMKEGVIDFIEKPFDDETMLSSVERALELGNHGQRQTNEARAAIELLASLTRRERNVFDQLIVGRTNKVAGRVLGISPRTAEVHRGRIMRKLDAKTLADLVRIALAAECKRAIHQ